MDKDERRRVALQHVIAKSDELRAEFERGGPPSGEMELQVALDGFSRILGQFASRLLYLETAVRMLADPEADPTEMFAKDDEGASGRER